MSKSGGGSKAVKFLGDSLERLSDFSKVAKQRAGYQIGKLQDGDVPDNFKPMKTVGPGAFEIKIKADDGESRVFYVANRGDFIYILHCFKKTTKKTEKKDIDLAKDRYRELP